MYVDQSLISFVQMRGLVVLGRVLANTEKLFEIGQVVAEIVDHWLCNLDKWSSNTSLVGHRLGSVSDADSFRHSKSI